MSAEEAATTRDKVPELQADAVSGREGESNAAVPRDRHVGYGNAESGAMKDLGKPCAGEPHARFDERGLETGHGLGTAAPAV